MNKKNQLPLPWHKDAKWICGILLLIILGPTLAVFTFYRLTSEEKAVELVGTAIATALSRNGLSDDKDIKEAQQMFKANPNKIWQPIPGLKIFITKKDFDGGTPREIRINFFKKIAGPLYKDGIQGLAVLAENQELKKQIIEGGAIFNVFTAKTHSFAWKLLAVFGAISAALLFLFIYFSKNFGRLYNPAIVFFLTSIPGVFIAAILTGTAENPLKAPLKQTTEEMAKYILSNLLPVIRPVINEVYVSLLGLAVLLFVASILGKIGLWGIKCLKTS